MKILFISPEAPWPLDTGGKIRSFNLLKNLAKKHEIVLVCFGKEKNTGPLSEICQRIVFVPLSLNLAFKLFNFLRSFFSQKPMKVLNFYSPNMIRAINQIIEKEKPDVLYFEHIYLAQYLTEIKEKEKYLKIFDTHNIYYRFFEHLSKSRNIIKAIVNKTQIEKMRNYEAKMGSEFDLICVCSENDKKALLKTTPRAKIEVIPNGVDSLLYRDLKMVKKENILLFIGSFDHFPNKEGIFWFVKKIFPEIRNEIGNVKLYLIGRQPPFLIQIPGKNPGIKILGYVEEVKPYLEKAKIFIVPLLSGGGTRLKILEAMAAKIPVVSTNLGAEGLDVLDEKNILLADSEKEFSKRVVQLLLNEKLRSSIIKSAFDLVKEKYDWVKITQILERRLVAIRHQEKNTVG